jgi:hypothetical protein
MKSVGQILSFADAPIMEKEDAGFFIKHVIMDCQNLYFPALCREYCAKINDVAVLATDD